MDTIDKRILMLLADNAELTATEIGAAVGLSVPAVNKRIRRLRQDGAIRRFTVLTDGRQLGKPIAAYILIVARYGDGIAPLLDALNADPDVLECYAVTGEYDYLLKVCARDVEALEEKLLRIKRLKGVVRSHTMRALQEHKFAPAIVPDVEEENA